jgi:membrane fusion protein, type I secretion system
MQMIPSKVPKTQPSGQPYFLVCISMTADEITRLNGLKLVPGMPVEAFIRTDERTLLSYSLKPLTDQAGRAVREK